MSPPYAILKGLNCWLLLHLRSLSVKLSKLWNSMNFEIHLTNEIHTCEYEIGTYQWLKYLKFVIWYKVLVLLESVLSLCVSSSFLNFERKFWVLKPQDQERKSQKRSGLVTAYFHAGLIWFGIWRIFFRPSWLGEADWTCWKFFEMSRALRTNE